MGKKSTPAHRNEDFTKEKIEILSLNPNINFLMEHRQKSNPRCERGSDGGQCSSWFR